jgi:hypothetical protein
VRAKLDEIIALAPKTVAMTSDMWTDNFKRRSYITFTLHFCTPAFVMHDVVLRTVVFPQSSTGENIKAAMIDTARFFNLQDKKIVYVTDQGANMVKACRLAQVDRLGCIGHALHKLVMVDGIGKCPSIQNIIEKAKGIVNAFTFKTHTLENEAASMQNELAINDLLTAADTLECDNLVGIIPEDDGEGLASVIDSAGPQIAPEQKTGSTTLKKVCLTRWNTILTMLDSLIKNQDLVERCLTKLRLFDKICKDDEWEIISSLAQFLRSFQTATAILSGAKYPTLSLILLFRADIEQTLCVNDTDSSEIRTLKNWMLRALPRRLPIGELHVVSSLMDPSQRGLSSVRDYLAEHEITAVDILAKYIDKFVDPQADPNPINNEPIRDQSDQTAAADQQPAWKKAKFSLLAKHSMVTQTHQQKIQQYRCLSLPVDDPLAWWKSQAITFPHLSALAAAVLCIPATSTPSERIFSTAGVLLNAKRSSLAVGAVDKIIFIHENSHLL